MDLTLIPFQGVSQQELRQLARDLRASGWAVSLGSELEHPTLAYNARRDQYRADALLDALLQLPGGRLLGVTGQDLYTGPLNFIFGLAEMPGRAALISLRRLRTDIDQQLFRERALKEAVHELGHTLGLQHCRYPGCVMHFSNTLADTDRKGNTYCPSCLAKLESGFKS